MNDCPDNPTPSFTDLDEIRVNQLEVDEAHEVEGGWAKVFRYPDSFFVALQSRKRPFFNVTTAEQVVSALKALSGRTDWI